MRIISQSGMIDLPYEQVGLVISSESLEPENKYSILAYSGTMDRIPSRIAEYSTPEKAKKAMEMLHDKWLSRMELEGGWNYTKGYYIQPNFWVLPKVFQFPQDEEIEV